MPDFESNYDNLPVQTPESYRAELARLVDIQARHEGILTDASMATRAKAALHETYGEKLEHAVLRPVVYARVQPYGVRGEEPLPDYDEIGVCILAARYTPQGVQKTSRYYAPLGNSHSGHIFPHPGARQAYSAPEMQKVYELATELVDEKNARRLPHLSGDLTTIIDLSSGEGVWKPGDLISPDDDESPWY